MHRAGPVGGDGAAGAVGGVGAGVEAERSVAGPGVQVRCGCTGCCAAVCGCDKQGTKDLWLWDGGWEWGQYGNDERQDRVQQEGRENCLRVVVALPLLLQQQVPDAARLLPLLLLLLLMLHCLLLLHLKLCCLEASPRLLHMHLLPLLLSLMVMVMLVLQRQLLMWKSVFGAPWFQVTLLEMVATLSQVLTEQP